MFMGKNDHYQCTFSHVNMKLYTEINRGDSLYMHNYISVLVSTNWLIGISGYYLNLTKITNKSNIFVMISLLYSTHQTNTKHAEILNR